MKSSSFFKYQLSPQFESFIDFPRMPMNRRKRTEESQVPATLTSTNIVQLHGRWAGKKCTPMSSYMHTHVHKNTPHQQISQHWLSLYSMQCPLQNSENIQNPTDSGTLSVKNGQSSCLTEVSGSGVGEKSKFIVIIIIPTIFWIYVRDAELPGTCV